MQSARTTATRVATGFGLHKNRPADEVCLQDYIAVLDRSSNTELVPHTLQLLMDASAGLDHLHQHLIVQYDTRNTVLIQTTLTCVAAVT